MIPFEWYWVLFVLVAAAFQTVRNATQRTIAGTSGTLGGTYARFIYALPFSLIFFSVAVWFYGLPSWPKTAFFLWVAQAGLLQILATASLLAAMRGRSFSVAVSLSSTAPIQVAIFALLILGEPLTLGLAISVIAATIGTMAISWPKAGMVFEARSVLIGLLSGSFFAMSSVSYRGATISMDAPFLLAASTTLVIVLMYQSTIMSLYMGWRMPDDLKAVLRSWRTSMLAGLAGASASQLWFSAYAIEDVARVRTLAVVEILYSQIVSARIFRERVRAAELLGIACIIVAIVTVLNA